MALTIYLGLVDRSRSERHLSYVPQMPGLEALCGRPLAATVPFNGLGSVLEATTCPHCRALMVARRQYAAR